MNIETAVMPVAGSGTRGFPLTASQDKFMMGIYAGDSIRPTVDYMVQDCVDAGIDRVIFVTSQHGKIALQDFFENLRPDLEAQLEGLGKKDLINREKERRRSLGLTYEYIIQPPGKHYGTAFPPFLAKDHLKGESGFVLVGGDDFIYNEDGSSELQRAITTWGNANTDQVIMGNPVDRSEASKYGIFQVNPQGQLLDIDEKPPQERVPSNPVANISSYGLSESIWPHITEEMERTLGVGEEHFITNAINAAIKSGQTFQVHAAEGKYMDGGTPRGLLAASNYINEHPQAKR
jgi:UTP--glucose-1-phosphate uridylyltransferase